MPKQKESVESRVVWGALRFLGRLVGVGKRSTPSDSACPALDHALVKQRWTEVEVMLKKNGPENFQAAVLNADKLLDYCLKGRGAAGDTMGERLKSGRQLFSSHISYQAAWDGHKLRNILVHDHETEVLFHQARGAIEHFKKALDGLGVL